MKKIASVLLVVVLVALFMATGAFAEETTTPQIVIDSVSAAPGEEVRVMVSMSNISEALPTNGVVVVSFDETGLELVDIDCEEETTWKGMVMANVEERKVSLVNPNQQKKDCVLFEIVLKVKEGAVGAFEVNLSVEYFLNDAGEDVVFEVVPGVVTIAHDCQWVPVEAEAGDCTHDGVKAHEKCSICGKLRIDGVEVTEEDVVIKAPGHTPAEAVKENEKAPTCTEDGSYESVVYCSVCGEELSRETVAVSAAHTPAEPVKENEVAPTCTEDGSYESVVYCSVCGEELSRETVVVPAAHTYVNGVCSVCGAEDPDYVSPETGDAIYVAVATALVSMMSVVALTKKKEF